MPDAETHAQISANETIAARIEDAQSGNAPIPSAAELAVLYQIADSASSSSTSSGSSSGN